MVIIRMCSEDIHAVCTGFLEVFEKSVKENIPVICICIIGEVQWLFAVGNYSKGYDPGGVSGGKDCGH